MISDEDVRKSFQDKLGAPGAYGGPGSLQIFRGKSPHLWEGVPPGGCQRHHAIFSKFGIIPEYCFDCYKVFIAPRTVMELFKLLMIFEKLTLPNDNTRKCMVEGRDDCSGAYKGFVYCQSMGEGKEVHKIVRRSISDELSPNVSVALKRGCSEFSHTYPEYSHMTRGGGILKYRKDWKALEDLFDKQVSNAGIVGAPYAVAPDATSADTQTYPPWEIFAMQYWLRYAATIGDISYLKVAGRTMPPVPQLKRPPFKPPPSRHR